MVRRRLVWLSWALLASPACSFRNCDSDALMAAGTDAAMGGAGAGGAAGQGGAGGNGGIGEDCDGDGTFEDLAVDASHCGVCDHECSVYECRQGSCVIAERRNLAPLGIAVDDSDVYFVGSEAMVFTIFRVAHASGPESVWLDTPAASAGVIADAALYAERLYLTLPPIGVAYAPKSDPMMYDVTTDPLSEPWVIDGQTALLCWTRGAPSMEENGVRCVSNDVLQPAVVTASRPIGMAVAGGRVYWTEADGSLWWALPDGSTPTTIESAIPMPGPLAVSGGFAYVLTPSGVWRAPVDGSGGDWLVQEPVTAGWDVIVVGDEVYWSALGDMTVPGGVYRAAIGGGAVEHLYEVAGDEGTDRFQGYVAAHGGYLYFGAFSEGRVLRRDLRAPSFLP